ncbi:TLR4 interactor with leucine rich repeats [Tachyglossus aculeatus]|uniref:TLR4 interactor with leucine rich repeats n=1 Tax=Tachyglossus aculeatus TaxID=9261 RepID=UPI0018F28D48|nr:TLR4 interactor with leucine rich repeats [Tachyglossus aculeatus]
MEAAWPVRPLLLLLLLVGCVRSLCPERCDCQHPQHLLCSNRGLRAVPTTGALPSPQAVLTYSLGGNFIANLTASDFPRLAQLRRLDLQFNQLRSLHPQAFERLSQLEELYLGNNLLRGLAPGTLRPLGRLRVLCLNGNALGRLSRGSFDGLGSLVKLRLDGNALAALPDSALAPLGNLLYLHLESNRLRSLGRHAFSRLGRLRFLNLSGNELQPSLRHPAAFAPLRALTTLVLSANGLRQLGGGAFRHLPRLAQLFLGGNRLAQLAPEAFLGLGALRELRLDGNRLSRLPPALLAPLRSLEVLDLSRNALSALHPAAFGPLARLRELSLRDNALSWLSGDTFAASPALHSLDLDGNVWTCDCRLRGLKRWMGAWHSQGRLLPVFVRCRNPPALSGKYLDYLDDLQLRNGSCPDASSVVPSPSSSSSPPRPTADPAGRVEGTGASPSGGTGERPQPLQGAPPPGGTGERPQGARPPGGTREQPPRRGLSGAVPGHNRSDSGPLGPARRPPPSEPKEKAEAPPPTARAAGGSAPPPAGFPSAGGAGPRSPPTAPPLVSDPCDFNKFILCNLTVEAVGPDTATVRWAVRDHRSPRPPGAARFRLLFDRFGQRPPFQRFVYLPERSAAATLRELRGDTPYLVCLEAVVGGRVCPVAPRDHCAGLLTPPEPPAAGIVAGAVDYRLLTVALLAVNALLGGVALGAFGWRWLRGRRRGRRKAAGPGPVRHVYSTRRPLRSAGTGVSADFSGFQPHRPRPAAVAAAACALGEADLIEFPCDRFGDSAGGRREDLLAQRFAD